MSRKLFSIFIIGQLVLFFSSSSFSHMVGVTDTSIEIARPGVRIIYTIPLHTLSMLAGKNDQETSQAVPAVDYINFIKSGWNVSAGHQGCRVSNAEAKELSNIQSYQYILNYQCEHDLDNVVIWYRLFLSDPMLSNKNFTKIFYGDIKSGLILDENKNILNIPVSLMLETKQSVLKDDFSSSDPNKNVTEATLISGNQATPVPINKTVSVVKSKSETKPIVASESTENKNQTLVVNKEASKVDTRYISLGIEHILRGYDHILFVIGLLLIPAGFWRLLTWVTAFTLAHSITLGLSVFDVVSVKPSIIEPLIALTIVFVALENLWFLKNSAESHFDQVLLKKKTQYRWLLTFVFGLMHGIGFSYVLKEMGSGENIVGTLFYFNVGVELGQLLVIALVLPMLLLLARFNKVFIVSRTASIGVGAAGFFWFLQRVV